MAQHGDDDLRQRVRERFGARAEGYRTSPLHASGADLDLLLDWLEPGPGERALDVATGGGHVALALARTGADVTACDLTPEMLEAAQALLEESGCSAAFVAAEADALPFADGTFDIVTCRIAAHHFPDAQAFLLEAARVLKPGGRLGFQDQTLPPQATSAVLTDEFERVRDPSHNQAYNVEGWLTLLQRAGFEVAQRELVDKRHDFAEWTMRQDCSDACIAELEQMMAEAPEGMRAWLEPEYEGVRLLAFRNRHLVILGTKPV
jgi:ubiquinone/menaquinone biosynthesis C-methylase UbiE